MILNSNHCRTSYEICWRNTIKFQVTILRLQQPDVHTHPSRKHFEMHMTVGLVLPVTHPFIHNVFRPKRRWGLVTSIDHRTWDVHMSIFVLKLKPFSNDDRPTNCHATSHYAHREYTNRMYYDMLLTAVNMSRNDLCVVTSLRTHGEIGSILFLARTSFRVVIHFHAFKHIWFHCFILSEFPFTTFLISWYHFFIIFEVKTT